MELGMRLLLLACAGWVFCFVTYMTIKYKLDEANALLWLVLSTAVLLGGVFPRNLATVFIGGAMVLLVIVFHNAVQAYKMRVLLYETASAVALLRAQVYGDTELKG